MIARISPTKSGPGVSGSASGNSTAAFKAYPPSGSSELAEAAAPVKEWIAEKRPRACFRDLAVESESPNARRLDEETPKPRILATFERSRVTKRELGYSYLGLSRPIGTIFVCRGVSRLRRNSKVGPPQDAPTRERERERERERTPATTELGQRALERPPVGERLQNAKLNIRN